MNKKTSRTFKIPDIKKAKVIEVLLNGIPVKLNKTHKEINATNKIAIKFIVKKVKKK